MTPDERDRLITHYIEGPDALRRAYESTPSEMRNWRPAPGEWSVNEIVCHSADGEMIAAVRIRMLIAEPKPRLTAIDQDEWARAFNYPQRSVDDAFAMIDALHNWTTPLLRDIPDEIWTKVGQHSESGDYTADLWLSIYGVHLHGHVDQINANVQAWNTRHS